MGTLYRYVNHTRKEFVSLSDIRDGGDKDNAAVWCGGVLAYLMLPDRRWGSRVMKDSVGLFGGQRFSRDRTLHDTQAVALVSDSDMDFDDMERRHGYTDVTVQVVEEMKRDGFWDGYAHAAPG